MGKFQELLNKEYCRPPIPMVAYNAYVYIHTMQKIELHCISAFSEIGIKHKVKMRINELRTNIPIWVDKIKINKVRLTL